MYLWAKVYISKINAYFFKMILTLLWRIADLLRALWKLPGRWMLIQTNSKWKFSPSLPWQNLSIWCFQIHNIWFSARYTSIKENLVLYYWMVEHQKSNRSFRPCLWRWYPSNFVAHIFPLLMIRVMWKIINFSIGENHPLISEHWSNY